LTDAEWGALLVVRRLLETAAGKDRRKYLCETLAEAGVTGLARWRIERRLKRYDFFPEELQAEIQAARESRNDGQTEIDQPEG
jgi:hypothetical protein